MSEVIHNWKHSGDAGDIIAALPAMRFLGKGNIHIQPAPFCRVKLTPDKFAPLVPLLETQPYINKVVEYQSGTKITVNFNDFRKAMVDGLRKRDPKAFRKSLVDWQLELVGAPKEEQNTAWITNVRPLYAADVIINKTVRYANPQMPWGRIVNYYGSRRCGFIGSQEEHEIFSDVYGHVPYYPTKDLLEAAQLIKGSTLFIGNQSACHLIAEGMKHQIVLECWPQGLNVLFYRDGVVHAFDRKVKLPEI